MPSTKISLVAALLSGVLSACAAIPGASGTPAVEPVVQAPMADPCNAAPAQFAIGRMANTALESEARTRAGAKTSRVLKPNQMVTMEFNAERLNLTVDESGRVTRVSCG